MTTSLTTASAALVLALTAGATHATQEVWNKFTSLRSRLKFTVGAIELAANIRGVTVSDK
jgi:hypothetical protein